MTSTGLQLKHISCPIRPKSTSLLSPLRSFLLHANLFWIEFSYFLAISSLGFLSLKALNPRLNSSSNLRNVDLFFTSVSATTASSMSTIDMEVFSNSQLIFMTIMMFVGGEVFTSMLGLHLMRAKIVGSEKTNLMINHKFHSNNTGFGHSSNYDNPNFPNIELGRVVDHNAKPETLDDTFPDSKLKYIKTLALLVLGYLLVTNLVGSIAIAAYIAVIPSAQKILQSKGLSFLIFPIFTTVSSFVNCGFIPTNENMVAFKKNSGLLIIMIPLLLMGNTLYPVCLRLSIWMVERLSKRREFRYILENSKELGYDHLMSQMRSVYLGITVLGLIILQFGAFCLMEWKNSKATGGLNWYQKLVACVFQVVNSRHVGESVFDLSALSSAILVLFVLMMFLPPYTSYLPIDDDDGDVSLKNVRKSSMSLIWQNMLFSQLTYLTLFVILICITERRAMRRDPLNFNVLNIVVEVISAYGNVGFSVGYHCGRQIKPDGQCKDASYGFAGRWSDEGKFVLIMVMFFGRLKKFNMRGGRAWSLQ